MPYINPAQHEQHEMTDEQKLHELMECCDLIATCLDSGYHWHTKAANGCRRIKVRGMARWHDEEAVGDSRCLVSFLKLVGDNLKCNPEIDMDHVSKAYMFDIKNMNDFKAHFEMWRHNETRLIHHLNSAIELSRCVDLEMYEKLLHINKEVQNERKRAMMAYDSFEFGGWSNHDISMKSEMIHDYMEHKHIEGQDINFNLG